MKKIRALCRWLLSKAVMAGGGHETRRGIVKARIPHSWFTKKGPGVEAEARRAFYGMTRKQKVVAITAGWFPESWR